MTILVPMEVSRVEAVGGVVQVWGYVGDYEICVYMDRTEAFQMGLDVPPARRKKVKADQPTIAESLYRENGGQQ